MITENDLRNLLKEVAQAWNQAQQFHQDEPADKGYEDWLFALVLLHLLTKKDYQRIIDWLDAVDDIDLTLAFLVGGEELLEKIDPETDDEKYVYEVLCNHLGIEP